VPGCAGWLESLRLSGYASISIQEAQTQGEGKVTIKNCLKLVIATLLCVTTFVAIGWLGQRPKQRQFKRVTELKQENDLLGLIAFVRDAKNQPYIRNRALDDALEIAKRHTHGQRVKAEAIQAFIRIDERGCQEAEGRTASGPKSQSGSRSGSTSPDHHLFRYPGRTNWNPDAEPREEAPCACRVLAKEPERLAACG